MNERARTLIKEARSIANVGVQEDDGEQYVVPASAIVEINRVLRAIAFELEESLAFEKRARSQEHVMLDEMQAMSEELDVLKAEKGREDEPC